MELLGFFGIRRAFGDGGLGHKSACGVNGLGAGILVPRMQRSALQSNYVQPTTTLALRC
jgi:hypothetical protein